MTRLSYGVVMAASVSLLGVASIASFAPRLIWNASASTPVGFYTIGEVGNLEVTDLVAVDAPEPLATFLSDGGYLPRGVPLLKRVAALGTAGLSDRARHHRRRRADGRRPRSRSSRPSAPDLARLPVGRERRAVPDELAGPRQPGRTLFRPASGHRRDRPGNPSLHRRGRRWPLRLACADAVTARP